MAERVHTAGEAVVVEVGGALLEGGKANEMISQQASAASTDSIAKCSECYYVQPVQAGPAG